MNGMSSSKEVQACIEACLDCRRHCYGEALMHCLRVGGDHAAAEHVALMLNCAGLCQVTADFMLSESSLHPQLCEVCGTVCGACAQSCAQLDGMDDCEAACRRCEEACRALRATPGAPARGDEPEPPTTGMSGGPPRQGM